MLLHRRLSEAEELSVELWMEILSFVPPLELLRSVTHVSKGLATLLNSRAYWRFLVHRLIRGSLSNNVDPLNLHQLQRYCIYVTLPPAEGTNYPEFLNYGSLLLTKDAADSIRMTNFATGTTTKHPMKIHARRVCLASSTEHASELLENVLCSKTTIPRSSSDRTRTLEPQAMIQQRIVLEESIDIEDGEEDDLHMALGGLGFTRHKRWWSSQPSVSSDSQETLLFVTHCPMAVISEVSIRALKDPFANDKVYHWKHFQIHLYRIPLSKLAYDPNDSNAGYPCSVAVCPHFQTNDRVTVLDSSKEHKALEKVLEGETPIFETGILTSPNQETRGPFRLHARFPQGFMANCVAITLMGKKHRQFQSSGYYVCVESIKVKGIPLPDNPPVNTQRTGEKTILR